MVYMERLTGYKFPPMPMPWFTYLERLQSQFPEALIAGGALRDHFLGVGHKDVDYFIQIDKEDSEEALASALADVDIGLTPLGGDLKIYQMNFHNVHSVWQNGTSQVIVLINLEVTMESVTERCDFGICRVAFDGQKTFYHEDFLRDVVDKTFTLRKCSDPESHWLRWIRFSESGKYVGFKLVAPEIVDWAKQTGNRCPKVASDPSEDFFS